VLLRTALADEAVAINFACLGEHYRSSEGNFAGDPDIKADSTIKARLFLSGIMVDAPPTARA